MTRRWVAILFLLFASTCQCSLKFKSNSSPHEFSSDHSRVPGPWTNEKYIELSVPSPEARNPLECELYENQVYERCRVQCQVQASFEEVTIMDLRGPRKLPTCRVKGTPCRASATNLTAFGYCEECECKFNRVMRSPMHTTTSEQRPCIAKLTYHDDLSSSRRTETAGIFNVIHLRFPAPELRNSASCESYETQSTPMEFLANVSMNDECWRRCYIRGNLGQITVLSPARYLKDQMAAEGTACNINLAKRIRGRCRRGVCVTESALLANESAENAIKYDEHFEDDN